MKKMVILIVMVFAACSTINIKGVNKAADFSITKYKSFGFCAVNKGGDAVGQHYDENLELLKKEISRQMGMKGVIFKEENPDLLVNIGVVVSEKTQTRETNFANAGDRTMYMGQRNYSWQSKEVEVGKYKEGTVSLDFVDRAASILVWKGSAESVLPEKQKNIQSLIQEGMEKLFAEVK